jgi:WS/DGAT/MGAT family acyltransferase
MRELTMAKPRYLNALDRMMLAAENRESMIHVGSLVPFSPPKDAPHEFLRHLMEEIKTAHAQPPWNLKLRFPHLLASPLQAWVEDDEMDIEYHVRRSALPSPGDERELGILVSRLHSNKLDFHRPPWEVHFIEGLEGGRFALYSKVHHALVDGYTGMRILQRSLSTDPEDDATPLFFARAPERRPRSDEAEAPTLDNLLAAAREQLGATKDVGKALFNALRPKKDRALVSPLRAPTSVLNQRVSRNRRFATQGFDIPRLKRVAKTRDGTLNDVVLALVAAALRRLLGEQDHLPAKALVAMVPVNVRPKDDPGGGNAVGAILASLATDVEDPAERFSAIVASTRRAKEQLQGMSKNGIIQYSALSMAPILLQQIPGAVGRVRPAFNVIVSNVPGSNAPLYFRGWRAEALYPVSIPFHGYGLNVTVISYADRLDFGFVGCRDGLPHLQRLAVYSAQALGDLETALGVPS